MLTKSFTLLMVSWMAQAAVPEDRQYNQPSSDPEDIRGRYFYLSGNAYQNQFQPQLQRLELTDNAQYFNPNQQRQDAQPQINEQPGKSSQSPAKLETLEPDAELIPGAQQAPQGPRTQMPVAPPPNIPGLLPGQRFYIVHPQHQIYNQNPLYPSVPNGYGPNVQVPGYQRFYIVQSQPGVGDGNFAAQAGYQNTILIDPTGQYVSPQVLQPAFQRLIAPQAVQIAPNQANNKNYAELNKNFSEQIMKNPEQTRNYAEPTRKYAEQNMNYPAYPEQQQSAEYVGGQPQFRPASTAFANAPSAALPYFGFGRQDELPFQQGIRGDYQNAVRFSQLISLQPGFVPLQYQGQVQPATPTQQAPAVSAQAQVRNDGFEYSDEEKKDDNSTDANTYDETLKKSDDKSAEASPEEPKSSEESKEVTNITTKPKAAASKQRITKRI